MDDDSDDDKDDDDDNDDDGPRPRSGGEPTLSGVAAVGPYVACL